jgi:tetratricopeptide (TPR) repeat protein
MKKINNTDQSGRQILKPEGISEQGPPSLGFAMRFEDNQCFLELNNAYLQNSFLLDHLLIQADEVSFPYDVSQGSKGFINKDTHAHNLQWSLGESQINDFLRDYGHDLFENFDELKLKVDDGKLICYGNIKVDGHSADFSFKIASSVEGQQRAVFFCYEFRTYGWLPIPAPAISVKLFSKLASYYTIVENVSKIIFEPHKLFFKFLLPLFGWDQIRHEELFLDRVQFINHKVVFASSNSPPSIKDSLAIVSDLRAMQLAEASIHFRDAERLMADGRLITAYKAYLYHGKDNPSDRLLMSRIASLLACKEDYLDKGAEYCRRVLDRFPDFFDVHNTLATIYTKQGKTESAIDCYRRMMPHLQSEDSPQEEAFLYLALGQLHERDKEKQEDAISFFNLALEHDYDNLRALQKLAPLQLAAGMDREGLDTYLQLSELVEDQSSLNPVNLRIGDIYRKKIHNFDRASDFYNKVLDNDRENPQAITGLADTMRRRGRFNQSIRLYDELADKASRTNDMKLLGDIHYYVGDIWLNDLDSSQNAVLRFRRALEANPENNLALQRLIVYYSEQQQWQQVSASYQLSLRSEELYRRPKDLVSVLYALGDIHYFKLGETTRAIYFLERALRYDPEHYDALDALRQIHLTSHNYRGAVDICIRLIAQLKKGEVKDPETESSLHAQVAEIYKEHIPDERIRLSHLLKALKLTPNNNNVFRQLLTIYTADKKWSELLTIYHHRAVNTEDKSILFGIYYAMSEIWLNLKSDTTKASKYLKKALEIKPENLLVLETLADIQRRKKQHEDLYQTLLCIEPLTKQPQMKLPVLEEIAEILVSKLSRTEESAPIFEKILQIDPNNREAIAILSSHFEKMGDWIKLVDILNIKSKHPDFKSERSDIFCMIAGIWVDYLSFPKEAINYYRMALIANSTNLEAFEGLRALYMDQGEFDALIELLTRQGDISRDTTLAISFYHSAAHIALERLKDHNAAINIYNRLLQVDIHEKVALSQLTVLYEKEESWQQLVNMLELRIDLETDDNKIARMHVRMGEIYYTRLEDHESAIDHYNQALKIDVNSHLSLRGLSEIYRDLQDWRRFFAIRERLLALVTDDNERILLHAESGDISLNVLGNLPQAIYHFDKVLEKQPHSLDALQSLLTIYEKQGDVPHAIETTMRILRYTEDHAEKAQYYFKLGETYRDRLDNLDSAIDSFEQVIEIDPTHTPAYDALIEIFMLRNEYNNEIVYLDRRIDITREGSEVIELLTRIADIQQMHLDNRIGSISVLQRILAVDPSNIMTMRRLEPLLRQTHRWEELLTICEKRQQLASTDTELAEYALKRAQLLFNRLDRIHHAASALREVLDIDPFNGEAYQTLSEIYQADGNWQALALLLEEQISREVGEISSRVDACMVLADIYKRRLDDKQSAIRFLELGRELRPKNQTILAALANLYEQVENWENLVAVLAQERTIFTEKESQIRLNLRIGNLLSSRLGLEKEAERYFLAAIKDQPDNIQAFDYLLNYYLRFKLWAKLAPLLVSRIQIGDDPSDTAYYHFWAGWIFANRLKESARARRLLSKANELFPGFMPALEQLAALLEEHQDWQELVDVWKQMIPLVSIKRQKVGLLLKTGRVLNTRLDDPKQAAGFYEQALDIFGDNSITLRDLADIYEKSNQPENLQRVLRRQLALGMPDEERAVKLLRLEQLLESLPDTENERIDLLGEVMQINPMSESALGRLEKFYSINQEWDKLLALYRHRIGFAEESETNVFLRVREAELLVRHLDDAEEAIRTLKIALSENSDYLPAIEKLAEIYILQNQYRRAADLYLTALSTPRPERMRLPLLLQLARLQRDKLNEADNAYNNFLEVITNSPSHLEALAACADFEYQKGYWQQAAQRYDVLLDKSAILKDLSLKSKFIKRLGICRLRLGQNRAAQSDLEAAIKLAPHDKQILVELAGVLVELGETIRAEEILTELVTEHANHLSAPELARYYLHLGSYAFDRGEYVEALSSYENAWSTDQSSADAALQLARLHRLLDNDRQTLQFLVLLSDRFSEQLQDDELLEIAYQRAELEFKAEDYRSARQSYESLRSKFPEDERVNRKLQRIYRKTKDWLTLADFLREISALPSQQNYRHRLLFELAVILYRQLDMEEQASEILRDLLLENVNYNPARLLLARIYRNSKMHSQLTTLLEQMLTYSVSIRHRLNSLLELGDIYQSRLGDSAKAIAIFGAVLDIEPGHDVALNSLESLYRMTGDVDSWLSVMNEQAKSIAGSTARGAHFRRTADFLLENKRSSAAAETYELVLAELPDDKDILSLLSDLYENLGETGKLIETYRRRISLADDPQTKALLNLKAGNICHAHADLKKLSIDFYLTVLDSDPENLQAFLAVEEQYQLERQFARLAEFYQSIGEATQVPTRKSSLLLAAADILREKLGEHVGASLLLKRHLQIDPRDESAWRKYIDSCEAANNLTGAAEGYRNLIEIGANQEELSELKAKLASTLEQTGESDQALEHYRDLANDSFEKGDLEQSAVFYEKVCTTVGNDPTVLNRLDDIYRRLKDNQATIGVLHRKLEIEPDNTNLAQLHIRLGLLLGKDKSTAAKSIEHYLKAIEIDPANKTALGAADKFYYSTGNHEALAALWLAAADRDRNSKNSAILYLKAGRIYEKTIKNLDLAGEAYTKAVAADEHNLEALGQLAFNAAQRKDYHKAVAAYEKLAELSDDVNRKILCYEYAADLYRKKFDDKQSASRCYNHIIELNPKNTEAKKSLLDLLREGDDKEQFILALARYNDSFDQSQQIIYLFELAELHLTLEQNEQAVAVYVRLRELAPKDHRSLSSLKRLYQKSRDWENLYRILGEEMAYVDSDETRASLALDRARLAENRLSRLDLATADYELVFKLNEEDVSAAEHLRRLYTKYDQWQKVVPVYRRLISFADDHHLRAELEKNFGDVFYYNLDDVEEALSHYRKSYDYNPEDNDTINRLITISQETGDEDKVLYYQNILLRQGDDSVLDLERVGLLENVADKNIKAGKLAEALEQLEEMIEIHPDRIGYRMKYARTAYELKEIGKAYDTYKTLDREFKKQLDKEQSTAIIERLAEIDQQLGWMGNAAENRLRLLGIDKDRVSDFDWLVDYFFSIEDFERIVKLCEDFSRLLESSDKRDELLQKLFELTDKSLGLPHKAERYAARLVELYPEDPNRLDQLERIYRKNDSLEGIINVLGRRLQDEPPGPRRLQLLKDRSYLFLERLNQLEDAARDLEEIIRLEPENIKSYDSLINCYRTLNNNNAVARTFETMLKVPSLKSSHMYRNIHLELANLYLNKLGNPALAAQTLEHLIDEGLSDEKVIGKLMEIFDTNLSEPQNAAKYALNLIERKPFQLELYKTLIRLYQKLGDDVRVFTLYSLQRLIAPGDLSVLEYFSKNQLQPPQLKDLKFASPKALSSMLTPSRDKQPLDLLLRIADVPVILSPEKMPRARKKNCDPVEKKRYPTLWQLGEELSLFLLGRRITLYLQTGLGRPYQIFPASDEAIISAELLKTMSREESIFMICLLLENFGRHLLHAEGLTTEALAAKLSGYSILLRGNLDINQAKDPASLAFIKNAKKNVPSGKLQGVVLAYSSSLPEHTNPETTLRVLKSLQLAANRSAMAICGSPHSAITALLKMRETSGRITPLLVQSGIEPMFGALTDRSLREEIFDLFRFSVSPAYFSLIQAISGKK